MVIEQAELNETEYLLSVTPAQHTEIRSANYIPRVIQNANRNKVQNAIKKGYVLLNDKQEKASYLIQPKDKIEISLPKPPPVEPQPEKMDLDIVYEDDHLIVVKKEAGMVVHPAYANWSGTLVNGLMHYTQQNLSKKDEIG